MKVVTKNNKSIAGFVFLLGTLIAMLASGCKEDFEQQKKKEYLDSLGKKLYETEIMLDHSIPVLKERMTAMEQWYLVVKDTQPAIKERLYLDFDGIRQVYTTYIEQYFPFQTAFEQYKHEFGLFARKSMAESVDPESFKKEYTGLKEKIQANFIGLARISQPVYDIEVTYQRFEGRYSK